MFAPFHSPMPRSALFSQIASSVILVREPAPLYNTCIICGLLRATHSHNPGIIIWVIKPFRKSPVRDYIPVLERNTDEYNKYSYR